MYLVNFYVDKLATLNRRTEPLTLSHHHRSPQTASHMFWLRNVEGINVAFFVYGFNVPS